jgi:hypothetical protein
MILSPSRGQVAQSARKSQGDAGQRFCNVLHNPQRYNGKVVTVSATYRQAEEASELYCLSCMDIGAVWVRFDPADQNQKEIAKALRPLKRRWGTLNGVFTGIFSGEGRYGHLGSYRYEMVIQDVRDVTLVDHLGAAPQRLPPTSASRVCH